MSTLATTCTDPPSPAASEAPLAAAAGPATSPPSSSSSCSSSSHSFPFSILSWNILADCYTRLGQFPYTPPQALTWAYRLPRVLSLLSRSPLPSILCLQEVDHYPDLHTHLSSLGYATIYTPRTWPHPFHPPSIPLSSSPPKADGLLLAYLPSLFLPPPPPSILHLNDLSFTCPPSDATRFWRQNIAVAIHLTPRMAGGGGQGVWVVGTHLFWSPVYEDVKVRQMQLILRWVEELRRERDGEVIVAGDFNSTPQSKVYRYVTRGGLSGGGKEGGGGGEREGKEGVEEEEEKGPPRLLVEKGLFRLAKWLRSIGLDTAYHQDDMGTREQIQRFFDQAVKEQRIIVTKSKTLCQRRHCPESFLLPSTASWESMLAALVGHFGLELIPSQFYTRCTLCNGTFERVTVAELGWTAPKDAPRRIVEEGKDELGQPLTFFRCVDCSQVYWWGSKSHGSARKFKTMFDRLARGNEAMPAQPVQPTPRKQEAGDREEVKEEERLVADSSGDAEVVSYTARLSIAASLFAAPPQAHSHQLHLRSAYAEYNRRTLPAPSPSASPSASASHYEPAYTNLTDKFRDTIDYVFYSHREVDVGGGSHPLPGSALRVLSVVALPAASAASDADTSPLPNEEFPSDHLPLQAEMELRWEAREHAHHSDPAAHQQVV